MYLLTTNYCRFLHFYQNDNVSRYLVEEIYY
nr:MAG TPA: hypothetical protein [Caudoviricetes sp.]